MCDFWYIVKDGNYLTAGTKFTNNFNLAYLYENKEQAEFLADKVSGEVMVRKSRKWIVVKDSRYLGCNEKFVIDINEAYSFTSKSIAEQYAQEFKGEAVQVLSK